MISDIQVLSTELRKIQSENIQLYAKLANLRKEKSQLQQPKEENDSNNDFKSQIEAIMNEQTKEGAKRVSAQKQLQALVDRMKQLQDEIDDQKSIIQNNLIPIINTEEELSQQFFQDVLEKCKEKPHASKSDINRIENLISQLAQKSKDYFESQDEIEKYTRLIAINENPIPKSSKAISYMQDYNSNIQSLNKARIRRKFFFKLDNL